MLCCLCSVPILLLSSGTTLLAPIGTAPAVVTQVGIPTEISLPTNIPALTNTPELILTETSQVSTPDGSCVLCNLECPANQEGIDFCIADPQLVADQALLEATLKTYCDSRSADFCKVLVWTDRQYLPSALPLTDIQLNNQAADYSRDKVNGRECFIFLSGGGVIYQSDGCSG